MINERFNYEFYMIRRKVLKVVGASFHIFNENGEVIFYVKQKGFKLKEDIKVYTGEDMNEELLSIKARSVIDFSATYDIYDSVTGQVIGALKRKGMKSILKDEWLLFDDHDREIGKIKEDSRAKAAIRRLLTSLVPQTFIGTLQDNKVFEFRQRFNIFVSKVDLDFTFDKEKTLDKRIGIAAAVLLSAIEGRQN